MDRKSSSVTGGPSSGLIATQPFPLPAYLGAEDVRFLAGIGTPGDDGYYYDHVAVFDRGIESLI